MNHNQINKQQQYGGDDAYQFCLKVFSCIAIGMTLISLAGTFLFIYLFDGKYIVWYAGLCVALLFASLELIAPMVIIKKLVTPLKKVVNASTELAKGNLSVAAEYEGGIKEISELVENFNVMSKELAGINTLRSDFVSNVSHEFKTPLATIEGYATLLQDPTVTEDERQEYINLLLKATQKLSALVGDVLLISKLENDNYNIQNSTYRLDEQINQVLLLLSGEWERKNIQFDLSLEPITYTGAETLLERVWANLIGNAIKYSEPDGNVSIKLSKSDDGIKFEIADEGIGIDEQALPHIFEKFYQDDTRHKSEGNGLGLAQVHNIINKTGNEISVKSQKGKGSTFTVILKNV